MENLYSKEDDFLDDGTEVDELDLDGADDDIDLEYDEEDPNENDIVEDEIEPQSHENDIVLKQRQGLANLNKKYREVSNKISKLEKIAGKPIDDFLSEIENKTIAKQAKEKGIDKDTYSMQLQRERELEELRTFKANAELERIQYNALSSLQKDFNLNRNVLEKIENSETFSKWIREVKDKAKTTDFDIIYPFIKSKLEKVLNKAKSTTRANVGYNTNPTLSTKSSTYTPAGSNIGSKFSSEAEFEAYIKSKQ